MGGRLRRSERRDQLLRLLNLRRERAGCAADFRAQQLARESGISVVWFYEVVGKEYRRMRSSLPDARSVNEDNGDSVASLWRKVGRLQVQIRGLKAKYEEQLRAKLAKAIRHIELLDMENRMLREEVALLQERLNEGAEE